MLLKAQTNLVYRFHFACILGTKLSLEFHVVTEFSSCELLVFANLLAEVNVIIICAWLFHHIYI